MTTEGKIASPSSRYLQYRAKISAGGSLQRVETFYRAPNRAPKLTWTLPIGGEYLSGKKTLTWTGTDPDSDALRYSLEIEKNGAFIPVELAKPTESTFELDTTKYPDGPTRLRLRASDATRNPDDPREASSTSLAFTLDNTAPQLQGLTLQKDGAIWTLAATATDATSPLSGAEWRVLNTPGTTATSKTAKATTTTEGKEPSAWTALSAGDGLFDSVREQLAGRLDPAFSPTPLPSPLQSGTKIEVRLRDAADNSTTQTVALP